MSVRSWLGPVVSRTLRAVLRRDVLDSCETCGGNGEYLDEDEVPYDCLCCEDSYEEPRAALDPADDTRLPDGSRWVDAAALALVAREVLRG